MKKNVIACIFVDMSNYHLGGIYKITNIVTNKVYIGSSNKLGKRRNKHFRTLKNNCHANKHLQASYNKYGKENFIYEVLEYVEDKLKLEEIEQRYLDAIPLEMKYNKRKIAISNQNIKYSKEYGESISKRISGKGNPFYGKTHTDETKALMSLAKLGKPSKKPKDAYFTIKVSKYSLEGEFLEEYKSLKLAALENHLPYKWFIETIRNNPIYRGFIWKKHSNLK